MTEAVITIIEADGSRTALHAPKGKTLHAVLTEAGYAVEAPCGGNGTCGKLSLIHIFLPNLYFAQKGGVIFGQVLQCKKCKRR